MSMQRGRMIILTGLRAHSETAHLLYDQMRSRSFPNDFHVSVTSIPITYLYDPHNFSLWNYIATKQANCERDEKMHRVVMWCSKRQIYKYWLIRFRVTTVQWVSEVPNCQVDRSRESQLLVRSCEDLQFFFSTRRPPLWIFTAKPRFRELSMRLPRVEPQSLLLIVCQQSPTLTESFSSRKDRSLKWELMRNSWPLGNIIMDWCLRTQVPRLKVRIAILWGGVETPNEK